jgi:aryl-alcohol dehydrogenase-like predicted oxidoreductase
MKYHPLGSADISVSEVCLGSMTWGHQNNQSDADAQIGYALDKGVNFIDTAEMYSAPPRAETAGSTENIIGDWLSRNSNKRKDIVLASKIAGPGIKWIRNGRPISGKSVKQAVEGSLARLQTDYLDLYQLHWPNRSGPHFGRHWIGDIKVSATDAERERETMHEILQAIGDCVEAGKIRHFGLSDDTTWGIHTYLNLSQKFALPRVVSIQNEFNMLHTKDWPYLIEHCVLENIAYLPWSPLAAGVLSGKYLNGQIPEGSRWSFSQRNGLFRDTPSVHAATAELKTLAEKYGMSLATMALAWCKQVDGVSSSIIGATSLVQLEENIAAFDVELSEELLSDIKTLLKLHASPF